jgi:biotin carboxylase
MRVLVYGVGHAQAVGLALLSQRGHVLYAYEPAKRRGAWVRQDGSLGEARTGIPRDHDWHALLCWDEVSLEEAMSFAHHHAIRHSTDHPRFFRHKGEMRERARHGGVITPQLGVLRAGTCDIDPDWFSTFPLVVKPADYGGSDGVSLAANAEAFREAVRIASALAPSSEVVVDRFVLGREYSVEAVSRRDRTVQVVSVTEKVTTGPPNFVELAHVVGRPDDELTGALRRSAVRVLQQLGLECGVSHAEFKVQDGSPPVLLEIAARMPGDHIPEAILAVHGVDLFAQELAAVSGEPEPRRSRPAHPAAAVSFRYGRVTSGQDVCDQGMCEGCPANSGVNLVATGGEPLPDEPRDLVKSGDRLGWLLITGTYRAVRSFVECDRGLDRSVGTAI